MSEDMTHYRRKALDRRLDTLGADILTLRKARDDLRATLRVIGDLLDQDPPDLKTIAALVARALSSHETGESR
jgi:hypothetical protein